MAVFHIQNSFTGSEVADWLSHALEDEQVARLLVPHGLHATIGYHCQQEGEKRLKALLVAAELIPPRTHNLLVLLDLLRKSGLVLADLELPCAELTPWATVSRYPGHGDLTAEDARVAMAHAAAIRAAAEAVFASLD